MACPRLCVVMRPSGDDERCNAQPCPLKAAGTPHEPLLAQPGHPSSRLRHIKSGTVELDKANKELSYATNRLPCSTKTSIGVA